MTRKEHLSIIDVNKPDWMLNTKLVERDFIEDLGLETEKLFKDIYIFFRNISIGIKNIVYYSPVIYNDRHWDYEFLLEIMRKKLINMRDGIYKDDLVLETSRIVNQINNTLTDIDNFYNTMDLFEMQTYDDLVKIRDTKDKKEKDKLLKDWYTRQIEFENECWNKIWDGIKENARGWWN